MIYPPSKVIQQALLDHQVRCDVMEGQDSSAVVTGFDLNSGDSATFHFISSSDKNDVAFRCFNFAQAAPDTAAAVLSALNQLNQQYRYAKFVLHEDDSVSMQMDIPQETVNLDRVAFELLVRSLDILAEASPVLKQAGAVLHPAQGGPEEAKEPAPPAEPKPEPEPKKRFHLFGGNKK